MTLRQLHGLYTKEIKKVRAILEYFRRMIGNTAEAWSCCSLRSDGDMLRVWFSCSSYVPCEHGVKMAAPIEFCTKDKQHPTSNSAFSWCLKE
jgi:hypothetical protein